MNLESNTGKQNSFILSGERKLTERRETESVFGPIVNKHQFESKEEVHTRLQKLIHQDGFRPGDRLPAERDLAKQLGVSRPTLREGIGILAAAGVIQSKQGVGNFVAEIDKNAVFHQKSLPMSVWLHGFSSEEILEAQITIEMDTAGLAAECATSEHLVQISEKVADMFASVDEPEEFLIHELRFHQLIAVASGNRILAVMLDAVYKVIFETLDARHRVADLKERAESHRSIYRSIRARTPEAARQTMRDFLLRKH